MLAIRFAPIVAATLIALAGCGPEPRPQVQGSVKYNGQPVGNKMLVLHFKNDAGEFFTYKIPVKADGTFDADAPRPDTYRVYFEESMAAQEGKGQAGTAIPEKYRSADTSDLTWTIKRGMNKRDFVLTD